MKWLLSKLSTKKCRGCNDPSPHNAHLTRFGKLRYKARFPR